MLHARQRHSVTTRERSVQDASFFSPCSGWRASHTTFNRKAALSFFSPFFSSPPLLFCPAASYAAARFISRQRRRTRSKVQSRFVQIQGIWKGSPSPLLTGTLDVFSPLPRLFWPYCYLGCGAAPRWYATTRAADKIRFMRKTQYQSNSISEIVPRAGFVPKAACFQIIYISFHCKNYTLEQLRVKGLAQDTRSIVLGIFSPLLLDRG